jgi:hypothetical protein
MHFTSIRLSLWLVGLLVGLASKPAQAQVVVPSEGGEVYIDEVTATSMTLSFGNSGTGQGRVVAIAPTPTGFPVQLAAIDGQFYTASATYSKGSVLGKGFAVYNGDGHTVTVTGLQPNTHYYVTNAEYNTDGSTIMYNISGSSTATATNKVAPLPVELTSFTGTVDATNMATLRWATASERNAAYFAIERSADGNAFSEIGRVTAGGTSSLSRNYRWPDPQRLNHLTYYRLRQVDTDGKVQYSNVVTLSPSLATARVLHVYPNPSAGHKVQLLLQGYEGESIELRLVDAMGRSVFAQKLPALNNNYLAPLALPQNLATGSYVLTLGGSVSPVQKRIVISN